MKHIAKHTLAGILLLLGTLSFSQGKDESITEPIPEEVVSNNETEPDTDIDSERVQRATKLRSLIYEAKEQPDLVRSLVLVDEDATAVLNLLEKLTNKSILRKQNLPEVKINFHSRGSLTQDEAILALESLLSMNGIAITEMGNFLKAVPATEIKSEAPIVLTESALSLPPSEKIYVKLFRLNFLSTAKAKEVLKDLMTPEVGSSIDLETSNALLITDTLANLQRIEDLLEAIDRPLSSNEEIYFYSMKYLNATELRDRLKEMQKDSLKKYLSENTSFEADAGTNQLIVITSLGQKPSIDNLIHSLDVDVEPHTRSEVFRIMHAKAKEVVDLIKAVVKGQELPEKGKTSNSAKTALERLREAVVKTNQEKPQNNSESSSAQKFSRDVTVEADERSNSIVAYGTPRDLDQIRALIKDLDILLAQVRIEAVIAQVTLGDDEVSGLSSFGIAYNSAFPTFTLGTPSTNGGSGLNRGENEIGIRGAKSLLPNGLTPSSFQAALKTVSIGAILEIARQKSNIEVLSAPTILTTHNKEAFIRSGESRSITKTSTPNANNPNEPTQTFEYRDIVLELKVTPLIGPNGIVQLEIEQKIENVINNNAATSSQPNISTRIAKSFISVANEEVVVLAGLQEKEFDTNKGKVWLLGDIPIIGDILFSPKRKNNRRRELVIFLKPYVLNNTAETQQHSKDYMGNMATGEQIQTYFDTGTFDGEKPVASTNERHPSCQPNSKKPRTHTRRWLPSI